ncbi:epsilon subunit of F1F0-ATP synthase N-terminal domain-containing protein [Cantharellus anzutake]|uniref:epsilon subunit of F1F0-ATP synthase N-terminal domain-containing protein n=1 Tax=Cantharellus anzutake TaxID=1750568 RepID=UPI0019060ABE|nr:epsilon subunit of F1F0-ATP synthase N-terminal domain-containing protein [Cantharellus anzutake]KAF8332836.1 epsilon subunit of F1F0-ATP synthase N-terminal domain-containing protein [Cantharellus anzutake]
MSALRTFVTSSGAFAVRRLASRTTPSLGVISRRGYAEAVSPDKLQLSLVLPHETIFKSTDVTQVNISAASGDMGILASHVPSVEPLRPGVLEIIESGGQSQKWFVSGGFAVVHPGSSLTINAVEAASLDKFSIEAIRSNLAEAQRVIAGSGSEEEKIEARIELEVYEALQHHVTS